MSDIIENIEANSDGRLTSTGFTGGGRVLSSIGRRRELLARLLAQHGNRDYLEDFNMETPDALRLQSLYEMGGIAKRVVEAYPDHIWSREIIVSDNEDDDKTSEFDLAFKTLVNKHRLWNVLTRAQYMTGYSSYSVIHIGVLDGRDKDEPFRPVTTGIDGLGFLALHDERSASINLYNTDINSADYNAPQQYQLRTGDNDQGSYSSGLSVARPPVDQFMADASRIIHVPADLGQNDWIGKPRLLACYYDLMGLFKVLGAAAESFVMKVRNPYVLSLDPSAADDEESINQIDEMWSKINDMGFSQAMTVLGGKIETVSTTTDDPTGTSMAILQSIAGTMGIPVRILTGSERGELASSQDASNFASAVMHMRTEYCEPIMLRPLVDRLIEMRILPEPQGGEYNIVWPSIINESAKDKASSLNQLANAMKAYADATGMKQPLLTPQQLVEEFIGVEYKEDEIEALREESKTEQLDMQDKTAAVAAKHAPKPDAKVATPPPKKPAPKPKKNTGIIS